MPYAEPHSVCVGPAPKNVDPLSLTDQHLWATFASGQVVAVAVNTHYLLGIAVLMCVRPYATFGTVTVSRMTLLHHVAMPLALDATTHR